MKYDRRPFRLRKQLRLSRFTVIPRNNALRAENWIVLIGRLLVVPLILMVLLHSSRQLTGTPWRHHWMQVHEFHSMLLLAQWQRFDNLELNDYVSRCELHSCDIFDSSPNKVNEIHHHVCTCHKGILRFLTFHTSWSRKWSSVHRYIPAWARSTVKVISVLIIDGCLGLFEPITWDDPWKQEEYPGTENDP